MAAHAPDALLQHSDPSTSPPQVGRLIELDFIRGVAILLALGWHFNKEKVEFLPIDLLLAPGRLFGWVGVDLFFVLSGFLIGGLLFDESAKTGKFTPTRFLVRRAFKIWPIFYLFLFLQLLLHAHPPSSYLLQNALHVQNYAPTPLSHLWSLAVEEHFYLLFATGYGLLTNRFGGRWAVPWIIAAILALALSLRILAVTLHVEPHTIQIQTQYRIDGLAFGVLLAYIKQYHNSFFHALGKPKLLLSIVWVSIAIVLANVDGHGKFVCSIGYTLTYIGSGAFLLFCYGWGPIVSAPRVVRTIAFLGTYSYALYIYQFVAVRPAAAMATKLHLHGYIQAAFNLILDYGIAIIVSILVTRLLERPFLSLRERLLPKYSTTKNLPSHKEEGQRPPVVEACDRSAS